MRAPLGPQDENAADDERERHGDGREQNGFDRILEEEAEHGERDECEEYVERETLRAAFRGQRPHDAPQPRAVLPAHGQNRGELDDDVEYLRLFAVEADQLSGDDQVAGARNGKEFGKTLDNSEKKRLEVEGRLH